LAAYKNSLEAVKGDIGVHHIVEAFKHTYAVRAYLADPAFEDITGVVADMMSPDFASSLQKTISDNTTFGPDHYGGK
jgi:gamma-glutamyltranspeptidase/glutathione hydrolase/leukotriene-C4 hydrolase